jgi:cobalt-zinc-cadmium efflux system outer membrane protein
MYVYLAAAILLLSGHVLASEACNIKTAKEFYYHIVEKGPILEEVVKKRSQIEASIEVAKQRPNPELDFEYLKGDEFGIDVNTYSLSAKHVIEFGNKRDKRIEKAENLSSFSKQQLDIKLYKLNIDSTINFQRIAQLKITIDAVKEAIYTFDKVIKKLSQRKRLNPEETVSLSTLRLASNDYRARLNDLQNERSLVEGRISYLAGCESLNPSYTNLNYRPMAGDKKSNKSGLLKLEQLKVDIAKSNLEFEKSLGYSDISVGPVVEYQSVGSDEFVSGGVSVSFALPLFQTNDGGKLEASKRLIAQKIESKNQTSLLVIKRSRLVEKFNRSLSTLKQMPTLKALENEHQKVEKLFSRGVVSISMTIESHRQLIDFLISRFETENDLLNTYGNITLIDGDLTSFKSLLKQEK